MTATTIERDAPPARPARRISWAWLGLVPFFTFALMFIGLPISYLVFGSFQDLEGQTTLQNYVDLTTPTISRAFQISIEISLVTAIVGGIFGFLLAYAVILGGLPPHPARRTHDVQRRRVQLRGRAARPGLHLHARPGRPGDGVPQEHRHRPVCIGLHDLQQARDRARLPLLPVPAHGPDHRAGHRRAAARVAGGRREHGSQPAPVLAAASRCRSSSRRCWAR